MQISSYMKNLRKNVIEADNNRIKAEKQLKFINNEIEKEKKYQLSLKKLEYDKYNNNDYINNYNNNYYYTNVNDVDPIYYDLMPINQSNMNNKNNEMSVLAKMGQNLIKLNSESEFVPIENNNYYNYNNIGINEEILLENNIEKGEIKNETIFQKTDE